MTVSAVRRPAFALALLLWLTLFLAAGCSGRPPTTPVSIALAQAQQAASKVEDEPARLQALTDVGVEWMKTDPQRGREILDRAREAARAFIPGGKQARCYAVAQSALALAKADGARAGSILLRGLEELQRMDPRSAQRYALVAELARRDLAAALRAIERLPQGDAKIARARAALAVAGDDLRRAEELMEAALEGDSPVAKFAEEWWTRLGLAGAEKAPLAAIALARKHIKSASQRARVLWRALETLAPKDWASATKAVLEEKEPYLRAWGWIALAHEAKGPLREPVIRRAAGAVREQGPARSDAERFNLIAQWSLLAVMSRRGPEAKQYLAEAERAMAQPPGSAELAVVMVAATYVDHAKALAIYKQLMRRGESAKGDAPIRDVLHLAADAIARIDVEAARRAITGVSGEAMSYYDQAGRLASLARGALRVGARGNARKIMKAAEEALAARRKQAGGETGRRDQYLEEKLRGYALESVARGAAMFGEPRKAMGIIGRIRDPGIACESYLRLARTLEAKAPRPMDAFEAVNRAAAELYYSAVRPEKFRPWMPAEPPRDEGSQQ